MPVPPPRQPRLPPRWFIHLFWIAHRRLYRLSGGRVGLWRPKPGKWGAMRLTTIGRRTGREHPVIVGYFEDGSDQEPPVSHQDGLNAGLRLDIRRPRGRGIRRTTRKHAVLWTLRRCT